MPDEGTVLSEIENYESGAATIRAQAAERLPAEVLAETQRVAEQLDATVVAEAVSEGDMAPDFTLPQAGSGETRSLSASLERGPVVLSFYRGQW